MSDFHGKTIRQVGVEGAQLLTVTDVDGPFGPSVECRDEEGEVVLVYQLEAFQDSGLYEIVPEIPS